MAHKAFGGWFLKKRLYLKIKIANELWYHTKDKGKETEERQTQLFMLGWYTRKGIPTRLYAMTLFILSIHVAVVMNKGKTG